MTKESPLIDVDKDALCREFIDIISRMIYGEEDINGESLFELNQKVRGLLGYGFEVTVNLK